MIYTVYEKPLLLYNTFGIPATASVFAESDSVSELTDFIRSLPHPETSLLLGGGSNILFVSECCDTVIHPVMKGMELIHETDDYVWIRAAAGEVWDDFVAWCTEHNYSGIENLSHIPGTVGACPIQNIGAYGAEVCTAVESVETIEMSTGNAVIFNRQQCQFGYRSSVFKKEKGKYAVTAVLFKLSKSFEPDIKYSDIQSELLHTVHITARSIRQAIINIRRNKLPDPAEFGNAGSFFKNPTIDAEKVKEISVMEPQAPIYALHDGHWKVSAAWLIQQCGWKGVRKGSAGVHEKQPLVLVNCGGAKGKDILRLAFGIIDSVKSKFGIELEIEVNIV